MSTFNVEASVYAGWSGSAVSALDGNSGTLLTNISGQTVQAQALARTMLKRHGTEPDQVVAVNAGLALPRVRLELRDCSDTTRKLLFTALTGDGSTIRTSGGSTTVGKLSATIQLWVKALDGGNDLELFGPAFVPAPDQSELVHSWSRDLSLYDGQALDLIATRVPGQSTPAMLIADNTTLAGVYFA